MYQHTAHFDVRHYECDAHENVHYANYLRYMQEAAFGASAAVGYSEARFTELGYYWLAYETGIEYRSLLRHRDSFKVKTWVHDFRRVRSLRRYDFYRQDELIAQATTDWVLIDIETRRPCTVPPEMVAAYAQGHTVEPTTRQNPLPSSKEPPAGVFSLRRRVEWRDVDTVQHVNNAVYIHFAEDCGQQARRERGWSLARLKDAGLAITACRHQIEYKVPAQPEEELEIVTWMTDVSPDSTLRHYLIQRASDGTLLTRVRAMYRWVDLATGEVVNIPESYLVDLTANTV